ncbi:MAG: hypothetical protein R2751_04985 [Bacteroidales bacterium]
MGVILDSGRPDRVGILLQSNDLVEGEYWFSNPHATRYFFGTNGYGLEKGEGYYQNTGFSSTR